jgi:hypothetical protein
MFAGARTGLEGATGRSAADLTTRADLAACFDSGFLLAELRANMSTPYGNCAVSNLWTLRVSNVSAVLNTPATAAVDTRASLVLCPQATCRRSKLRYCTASLTCFGRGLPAQSRSAIARASIQPSADILRYWQRAPYSTTPLSTATRNTCAMPILLSSPPTRSKATFGSSSTGPWVRIVGKPRAVE